ncbi:MAG TPA: LL-diaminopimelate aminotransferase [Turneriella sp.]|nr:LL-diaminopimelate aminotransferase [Turneriella sp.]
MSPLTKAIRAKRISNTPPYLFAEIDKKKAAAIQKGINLISFGIGDPDLPTPKHIVDAMHAAIDDAKTHDYPPYEGTKEFREAVAVWMYKRFGVSIDPVKEAMALIGSKEAIAHIHTALVDKNDVCLIPSPSYPVYRVATIFSEGIPYNMPLKEANGFLPDLKKIPADVLAKAKLIWVNYPNNPTGAVCDLSFYEELVAFAKKNNIIICSDNAYSEMTYDGFIAPSILQIPGAKDVAIEFLSLSKAYNMTGWRLGMAVGNEELIAALGIVKTNTDSGQFKAIQKAGAMALTAPQESIREMNAIYQKRRDAMVGGLNSLGWNIQPIKGTFYIWAKIPPRFNSSADFCGHVLDETGIVLVPGNGYGDEGEGYFRAAITVSVEKIEEGIRRLKEKKITF